MVERLKEAIEKARQRREAAAPPAVTPRPTAHVRQAASVDLSALPALQMDPAALERHRVVTHTKSDPAHIAFDLLRTRMLSVCRENGWRRVGVSSPTKGCGKSTICVNLAFSLARQARMRVLLLDLDLRHPRLAPILGATDAPMITDLLTGAIKPDAFFRRVEENLIVGLGAGNVRDSAEMLQDPDSVQRVTEAVAMIEPDIVLCDLPPVLVGDDVLGFLPHLDCLMMVVAAGMTRPDELEDAERLITGQTNFLGVLLNRFGGGDDSYPYE